MAVDYTNFAINDSITGTAAASADTLYSSSNGRALINQATAHNADTTSSVTVYFYILPSGVAAADVAPIWKQVIAAGGSVILDGLLGHVVPSGGSIQAYASTADDAKVTLSGAEIV